jgi:hypothetical protein
MRTGIIILLIALSGCLVSKRATLPGCGGAIGNVKPVSLTITHFKNGFTYARNSYKRYRAWYGKDSLKPGDVVIVYPCKDSANPHVFRRIN